VLATKVDPLIREANRDENLPRLERFDPWGDPQEDVIFHPAHHEAGKHIYSSGAMEVYKEQGANLIALSLFYLSAQNGEAGHNCPLACTAGLIKALQALGTPEQQNRYLPSLLNPDYDQLYHGAQFLTEVQGGSDVGANGTWAVPGESDGLWYLSGEKWFCSNVTADLALVTARVPEQGEGTRGLGLFLMPRYLEDGSLNSFTIMRLKEKKNIRVIRCYSVDNSTQNDKAISTIEEYVQNNVDAVLLDLGVSSPQIDMFQSLPVILRLRKFSHLQLFLMIDFIKPRNIT